MAFCVWGFVLGGWEEPRTCWSQGPCWMHTQKYKDVIKRTLAVLPWAIIISNKSLGPKMYEMWFFKIASISLKIFPLALTDPFLRLKWVQTFRSILKFNQLIRIFYSGRSKSRHRGEVLNLAKNKKKKFMLEKIWIWILLERSNTKTANKKHSLRSKIVKKLSSVLRKRYRNETWTLKVHCSLSFEAKS